MNIGSDWETGLLASDIAIVRLVRAVQELQKVYVVLRQQSAA